MQIAAQTEISSEKDKVVTKAVLRAAERLGLTAKSLGQVLGVSEPTVSRMKQGAFVIKSDTKPYELAVLLIRVFRSLDAILGGDEKVTREWMANSNQVLGAPPKTCITSISGLMDVIAYLDARRAVL
jgi:DNA-binding XRE family transcriptional regulator